MRPPLPVLVIFLALQLVASRPANGEVTCLGSFGSEHLSLPRGMAFDPQGRLFVGNFSWPFDVDVFSPELVHLAEFGRAELDLPGHFAFLPNGEILVSDLAGHIDRFSAEFQHLGSFGHDQLIGPSGLFLDDKGRLLVSNSDYSRQRSLGQVEVYDGALRHLGSLGAAHLDSPLFYARAPTGQILVTDRYTGQVEVFNSQFRHESTFGDEDLAGATGIAIDSTGQHVHVADFEDDEIHVYGFEAQHLRTYGKGFLDGPTGLLVRENGVILVADTFSSEIERFFDSEAWVRGTNQFEHVRIGSTPVDQLPEGTVGMGSEFILGPEQSLTVTRLTVIEPTGRFVLDRSEFHAGQLDFRLSLAPGEAMPAHGTILADNGSIHLTGNLHLSAAGSPFDWRRLTGTEVTLIRTANGGRIEADGFAGLVPGSGFEIATLTSNELTVRFVGDGFGQWAEANGLADARPDSTNDAGIAYQLLFALKLPLGTTRLPLGVVQSGGTPRVRLDLPPTGLASPLVVYHSDSMEPGTWAPLPPDYLLEGADALDTGQSGPRHVSFPPGDRGFARLAAPAPGIMAAFDQWAAANGVSGASPRQLNEFGLPFSLLFALRLPAETPRLPVTLTATDNGPVARIDLPAEGLAARIVPQYNATLLPGDWSPLPDRYLLGGPGSLNAGQAGPRRLAFPPGRSGFLRFLAPMP